MRYILLLTLALASVSCAEYSGATYGAATAVYAGNGDAGGGDPRANRITSEYRARTFMTDLKAGKFGPKGATVAGQNQSKVPMRALDAAVTIGGGMILAGVQKAKDGADAAVAIGAQKAAKAQGAQAAGVATEGIRAGVETTEILHSIPK